MALDPETREALHEIRDLIQKRQIETDIEIQNLKTMFQEHVATCDGNNEVLSEVAGFLQELRVSFTWANRIRRFVLWIAVPATTIVAFWNTRKGP